ncbi:MAG TPA: type II secretion system F family protein [Caulobacteraceae bacterium]|jgi:tight adherence protein B|nr:type II secretion system F family protein [Caulobacteraceae bacterium]
MIYLVAILGFITIAGLGYVLAGAGGADPRVAKRAKQIAAPRTPERNSRSRMAAQDAGNRRKQLLQTLKEQERLQRKASVSLVAQLQQAGLNVTVTQFWIASGVLGTLVLLSSLVLRAPIWAAFPLGLAAAFGLPRWTIKFLAGRRTKKFTGNFSDAIDIIVRGIKSGLPVHECLRVIARESPAPLGPEFQRLVENISMGMGVDQGLEKMYERMPTPELRFFTIVLAIQAKTGGNLAEALSNLSAVLRARKLMREKIKALSSEATASAFIIGSLPICVSLLITLTTPTYMAIMYTDSRGKLMLLAGAVVELFGIWIMRRMINFKF